MKPVGLFLDTHNMSGLPDDLRRKLEGRVRSGEKDSHGVIDRGIIIDKERGEVHCLLDAPDENAVRKHHEEMNVPLEEHTVRGADAIVHGRE